MFDIDLRLDEERILRKNLFNKVTLTYKGMSDDDTNLLFSIYTRRCFSKDTKDFELPISDLERFVDMGVEPFQIMVTDYNPDFITCYISGIPFRVATIREYKTIRKYK